MKNESTREEQAVDTLLEGYRKEGNHGGEMQKPPRGLMSMGRDSSALQRKHENRGYK